MALDAVVGAGPAPFVAVHVIEVRALAAYRHDLPVLLAVTHDLFAGRREFILDEFVDALAAVRLHLFPSVLRRVVGPHFVGLRGNIGCRDVVDDSPSIGQEYQAVPHSPEVGT